MPESSRKLRVAAVTLTGVLCSGCASFCATMVSEGSCVRSCGTTGATCAHALAPASAARRAGSETGPMLRTAQAWFGEVMREGKVCAPVHLQPGHSKRNPRHMRGTPYFLSPPTTRGRKDRGNPNQEISAPYALSCKIGFPQAAHAQPDCPRSRMLHLPV